MTVYVYWYIEIHIEQGVGVEVTSAGVGGSVEDNEHDIEDAVVEEGGVMALLLLFVLV